MGMEITDKAIEFEGIALVGVIGIIAVIINNMALATGCIGVIGGFIGNGVIKTKKTGNTTDESQAIPDTEKTEETPVNTDEAEAANMDTGEITSTIGAPLQVTLSDATVQAIANAITTRDQQKVTTTDDADNTQ